MRSSLLPLLLGLTTLLLPTFAAGESPKQKGGGNTTIIKKDGKVTILVAPPKKKAFSGDEDAAEQSDDEKPKKKGKKAEKEKAEKEKAEKEKADKKKAAKDDDDSDDDADDDKAKDTKASKDKKSKAAKDKQDDPIEQARRGVVTIERAGEVVGVGSVLGNDGRILTALSPLGDGNNLTARYADGSTVKTKLGHSNRVWDMAMLVPQVGKWPDGLSAAEGDPTKSKEQLRSFTPGKGKAQAANVALKGRRNMLGADEQSLAGVYELGTKLGAKELGSPIVNEQGNVVAMVGRACMPVEKGPCLPTPFGIPTPVIRKFLAAAPPNAVRPAPWLGIRGAAEKGTVSGVRVLGVLPDSPADDAGLKGGSDKALSDLIVAVDDVPVSNLNDLSKGITEKSVGDKVKLLLFRQGKFHETNLVLQPAPPKADKK